MQTLLFGLMALMTIFIWLGQRRSAIYCFAITMLIGIAILLSHTTTDLHLQL